MNSWHAVLKLKFKNIQKKTILFSKKSLGPLIVQHPFYPEKKVCHTYIIHPPGGIVSGDILNIIVKLKKNTNTLFTNPSATKFYCSNRLQKSKVKINFYIEDNASLEWLPQNSIFFPNSYVDIENNFFIKNTSKIIIWETLCINDMLNNYKKLQKSFITNRTKIWINNFLFLNEKINIIEEKLYNFLDYSIITTLFGFPVNKNVVKLLYKFVKNKKLMIGITLIKNLLIIKILEKNNITNQNIIQKIWKILRPEIIGEKICIPRIWFT